MSSDNKKISQLTELLGGQVSPSDWIVIVDVNAKETKKIKISEMSEWFSISDSLYVYHSDFSDTASWAYNIVGNLIPSASFSKTSSIAIYSLSSLSSESSSYSETASYAMNGGGSGPVSGQFYNISVSLASSSISSTISLFSNFSDTASYLQYYGIINGSASYALFAENVVSASWVSSSVSSSYSSVADVAGVSSASLYASSSNEATTSLTASYLIYTGIFNGTSSYSMMVSSSLYSDKSSTASYLDNTSFSIKSASYSDNSKTSNSSSYLVYSSNNGTASYAMSAGNVTKIGMNVFGMFYPTVNQPDVVGINVLSFEHSSDSSLIDVCGDAILDYTSSVNVNPSLSLYIFNTLNGYGYKIDASSISFNTTPVINMWGSLETGSFNTSFRLVGEALLSGSYYVYITSSWNGLRINTASRYTKFTVSGYVDDVTQINTVELPTSPHIVPTNATGTFYMTGSGPYHDSASNIISSGSNMVSYLDISNAGVTDIKYTYNFSTMSYFNCSNNPGLKSLGYKLPSTIDTLLCYSCSITLIYDMSSTYMTNFICSYNNLTSLPNLSSFLVNLDCSHNPALSSLPSLPSTLQTIIADGISVSTLPSFPVSLITASFSSSGIISPPISLPSSMSYINLMGNSITYMPDMGISCSYVNVSYCSLNVSSLTKVVGDLVSNNQLSGTLDIRGYGPVTDYYLSANLLALQTNGWTILVDT